MGVDQPCKAVRPKPLPAGRANAGGRCTSQRPGLFACLDLTDELASLFDNGVVDPRLRPSPPRRDMGIETPREVGSSTPLSQVALQLGMSEGRVFRGGSHPTIGLGDRGIPRAGTSFGTCRRIRLVRGTGFLRHLWFVGLVFVPINASAILRVGEGGIFHSPSPRGFLLRAFGGNGLPNIRL